MRPRLARAFLACLAAVWPAAAGLAPGPEIWRIGLKDDSSAEYAAETARPAEYTVPGDWAARTKWPDFPGVWEAAGDGGRLFDIVFSLAKVPAAAYIELGVAGAAGAHACRISLNGRPLAAQWICGGRAAEREPPAGPGARVYWPIPVQALRAGSNTLSIWRPRAYGGPDRSDGAAGGRLYLDYLSLVAGEKNLYQPILRGAAMRWLTAEAFAYLLAGGGVDGSLCYGRDTFDDDVEILKLWRIGYVRTGIPWACLERARDRWHEETFADYEYQLRIINSLGIRTWVALELAPRWASGLPGADPGAGPATGLADWADFCRRVAERLGRYADNWLVGLEPDAPPPFGGTEEDYLARLRAARAAFLFYDTIDADGDGIAAQVAPEAFAGPEGGLPGDYTPFLAREAASLFQTVHYHDWAWGDYARLGNLRRLFPGKRIFLDGWGTDGGTAGAPGGAADAAARSLSGEPLDEMRYLRFFEEAGLDGYAAATLKGDPNGNCSHDGRGGNHGNCWVDAEPDGGYLVTSGGAYAQHYQWLYAYDGPLYPAAVEFPDGAEILVDAVRLKDRWQVLATNFARGGAGVPVRIRLPMPAGAYRVKFFDPYYPGPEKNLEAKEGWLEIETVLEAWEHTRTVRMEVTKI